MVDFSLKNFSFTYASRTHKALNNINLTINRGEFVVICGKSGSGKSTLLSMLKPEITPHGKTEGELLLYGKKKETYSLRESACDIGYLLQNPDYQTVTHSVRSELAFGLENLGLDSRTIRLRIAEISAYFSLQKIMDKKINELSGGQKQLICLAGILAMHPKALIFDEPASQLDPMAAQTLFSTALRLCRENGITVIVTEHRLENIVPDADRIIVLEQGSVIADCPPQKLDRELFNKNSFINSSMPSPMRISAALDLSPSLPLNVGECRRLLEKKISPSAKGVPEIKEMSTDKEIAVEAKNVYFAYNKYGYVLNKFSIKIPRGSFFGILGANASGKSTAISLLSGLLPCKAGKISILGKNINKYKSGDLYNGIVGVMPQKCECLFSETTVKADLMKTLSGSGLSKEEKEIRVMKTVEATEISRILDSHPYDISGGEMQRAALAVVLLKEPEIIFMDEPTKGMDPLFKIQFAKIIGSLCKKGTTVIMVSHDTEFCASYCDKCAMISDGMCVLESETHSFFASNYFYTTASNKIARDYFPLAVTEKEVIELCLKNLQK